MLPTWDIIAIIVGIDVCGLILRISSYYYPLPPTEDLIT